MIKDKNSAQLGNVVHLSFKKSMVANNLETALLTRQKSNMYLLVKRAFDFIFAFMGVFFLFPLFLIVSLLIKIEDPKGPVFFKQMRVGKNGQIFAMYKFRSMVVDAEKLLSKVAHLNETTGALFKIKNDPRVTKIGKVIRKTSIDELPQLWNVIKGDMSLVGPRPSLPMEVAQYTPNERQRLFVTPGCTGLWQVSGRSNIGFEEMVELDLEYIKQRSLIFDIKIIWKTILTMFYSQDAY